MPAYTDPIHVPNVESYAPPAQNTSFGLEVSGPLTRHAVGNSSAPPQDGEDGDIEDVHEEVNVQAQ